MTSFSHDIDWFNRDAIPGRWQDAFGEHDFFVPCGGVSHLVRWTPDGGAVSLHHKESTQVVVALGGEQPMCERVAEKMNAGSIAGAKDRSGNMVFSPWTFYYGSNETYEERSRFADVLSSIDNGHEMVLRGSPRAALSEIVTNAFSIWLRQVGFPVGDRIDIEVWIDEPGVTVEGEQFVETPLVGMQMCVGSDAIPRAILCVTSLWLSEVKTHGLVRNGRFFLGFNEDGPVYSHMEVMYEDVPYRRLVSGWAKLFSEGDPDEQNMELFVDAFNTSSEPNVAGDVFVGSYRSWSYDDERYHAEEGGNPKCILRNLRDAESWRLVADFKETFVRSNDLMSYANVEDMDFPIGFDLSVHGKNDLLRLCVQDGINPFYYELPMASFEPVHDLR
jgi:hypothetical protein